MSEEFNLSSDFFEDVLASYLKKGVRVVSHSIQPAVDKGENFASAVYRAKVNYEGEDDVVQSISLIMKVSSADDTVNAVLEEFQTFDRELTTYKEVLPGCTKLMEAVGDSLDFSPR